MDGYPGRLYHCCSSWRPTAARPKVVLLTPGSYNSAYFEHCYLAQQMGIELVRGQDLVVLADDCVYMKTIGGLVRVHVIYRRVDDAFLDPEAFDPSSLLGVAGLLRAWHAGKVALVNAPGAGVADDKLVYSYVPDLIRYYLGEQPILPNVETFRLVDETERSHVLERLENFVVKPVNESGGYGVMVGSAASSARARPMPGGGAEQPAQLRGAADRLALHRAHAVRRTGSSRVTWTATVRPQRREPVRHARRAHTRGPPEGLLGGQLLSGRRQQGHLDRLRP